MDETCDAAGACQAACIPNCVDKSCGTDGCGGSCGACAEGEACTEAGACEIAEREGDTTGTGDGNDTPGAVDPNLPIETNEGGTSELGSDDATAEIGSADGTWQADSGGCEGAPQGHLPWFLACLLGGLIALRRRHATR